MGLLPCSKLETVTICDPQHSPNLFFMSQNQGRKLDKLALVSKPCQQIVPENDDTIVYIPHTCFSNSGNSIHISFCCNRVDLCVTKETPRN